MNTADDLLWRWLERPESLDADAIRALHEALRADPALALRARCHLHLDEAVARAIDPARRYFLAGVRERLAHTRRQQRSYGMPSRWIAAAAVAASLLIALGVLWTAQRHGRAMVAIRADGSAVPAGILVASDKDIVLTLREGLRVHLAQGAALRISADSEPPELLRGALTAEAAARTGLRHVIRTAHGSVALINGRCHLTCAADRTDLEVAYGQVALINRTGSIDIPEGRRGRIAADAALLLLPLERRWTFEDPALPDGIVSGSIIVDPQRGRCLRGTRYHEPTNSLGLLAIADRGLTRCASTAELTFAYCIRRSGDGPLYVWMQGADGSEWRLPIAPAAGWQQLRVPLLSLAALDDPTRHPHEGLLVTHLAISIGDGVQHELLLDDVTMPQP